MCAWRPPHNKIGDTSSESGRAGGWWWFGLGGDSPLSSPLLSPLSPVIVRVRKEIFKGLRVGAMQGRRDMYPSRSSLFLLTSNTLFGTVDLRAKRRNLERRVWLIVVGVCPFCVLDAAERCLLATVNGKVKCAKRASTKRKTTVLESSKTQQPCCLCSLSVYEIWNSLLSRNALWTASPQER